MRVDDKFIIEIIGGLLFFYFVATELAQRIGMNLLWFAKWVAIFSTVMFLIDSVILWWHLGKFANYRAIIASSITAGGFLSLLLFYIEYL